MSDYNSSEPADHIEDEALVACRVRQRRSGVCTAAPSCFSGIGLADKPLIERVLRQRSGRPSELTFTNLFIWQQHFNYSYCLRDDVLLIRGEDQGKPFLLEPLGSGVTSDVVSTILKTHTGVAIERASETFCTKYLNNDERFEIRDMRDHWDYIYARDDLAHLKGRRYHRKRNHVSKFVQNYRFEYHRIDETKIDDCRAVMDEWCRDKHCEHDPGLCAEKEAATVLLDHYTELELIGGLLEVSGKPVAFAIAESIDGHTALIHVEKAVRGLVGLYQAVNKFFCENSLKGFSFVNREQDLGIEGLRKAKESYFPLRMLKKFRVTIL